MRKTLKNKLVAIALIGLGIVSMTIEKDATFMVFALLIGIGLFFARENYIG